MAESTSVDEFIVGQSAATKELRRLVDILVCEGTVLIQGKLVQARLQGLGPCPFWSKDPDLHKLCRYSY